MAESKDLLVGTRIGHCEIRRRIGAGGMGAVYLAHHVGLDKDVAVKVLPRELMGGEDNVQRFIREARTAARLEHPNIVQVHDVGEANGLHYLVMQYVDGKSLDAILRERGKLPLSQAVSVAKRVAAALAAAHRMGVIHRDIKPANVLISKDGIVKVVDFGLARSVESGHTISSAGQIIGTPHYMAPEQAKGEKLDGRTDIYSLGATFYQLVTGEKCFDGTTPLSVVIKQVQEEPRPAHVVNPDLAPAVSAVVGKMMAKDPAARYQTADEVMRALSELVTPGETRVRPDGAAAPEVPASVSRVATRRIRRLPKWTLPACVAGAAALMIVLWLAAGGRSRRAHEVAASATPAAAPSPTPAPSSPEPSQTSSAAGTTATPAPPPEAGLVRGVPGILESLKARPREVAAARELFRRLEELVAAVQKKDPKALKEFVAPRSPLPLRAGEERTWSEAREHTAREMQERAEKAPVEHVSVVAADVDLPRFGAPRCVLTLRWTVSLSDGARHTTPEQAVVWVKIEGKWYVMPDRDRPRPGK